MDAKTLAKVFQVVLQEELPKIVRKELSTMKKEIIREIKANKPVSVIKESTPINDIDDAISDILENERNTVAKKATKTPEHSFSKNPAINAVLNQTAQQIVESKEGYEDYPTLGSTMTSENAQGMGNYRELMQAEMGTLNPNNNKPKVIPAEAEPPKSADGVATPEFLTHLFNRDWSKHSAVTGKK